MKKLKSLILVICLLAFLCFGIACLDSAEPENASIVINGNATEIVGEYNEEFVVPAAKTVGSDGKEITDAVSVSVKDSDGYNVAAGSGKFTLEDIGGYMITYKSSFATVPELVVKVIVKDTKAPEVVIRSMTDDVLLEDEVTVPEFFAEDASQVTKRQMKIFVGETDEEVTIVSKKFVAESLAGYRAEITVGDKYGNEKTYTYPIRVTERFSDSVIADRCLSDFNEPEYARMVKKVWGAGGETTGEIVTEGIPAPDNGTETDGGSLKLQTKTQFGIGVAQIRLQKTVDLTAINTICLRVYVSENIKSLAVKNLDGVDYQGRWDFDGEYAVNKWSILEMPASRFITKSVTETDYLNIEITDMGGGFVLIDDIYYDLLKVDYQPENQGEYVISSFDNDNYLKNVKFSGKGSTRCDREIVYESYPEGGKDGVLKLTGKTEGNAAIIMFPSDPGFMVEDVKYLNVKLYAGSGTTAISMGAMFDHEPRVGMNEEKTDFSKLFKGEWHTYSFPVDYISREDGKLLGIWIHMEDRNAPIYIDEITYTPYFTDGEIAEGCLADFDEDGYIDSVTVYSAEKVSAEIARGAAAPEGTDKGALKLTFSADDGCAEFRLQKNTDLTNVSVITVRMFVSENIKHLSFLPLCNAPDRSILIRDDMTGYNGTVYGEYKDYRIPANAFDSGNGTLNAFRIWGYLKDAGKDGYIAIDSVTVTYNYEESNLEGTELISFASEKSLDSVYLGSATLTKEIVSDIQGVKGNALCINDASGSVDTCRGVYIHFPAPVERSALGRTVIRMKFTVKPNFIAFGGINQNVAAGGAGFWTADYAADEWYLFTLSSNADYGTSDGYVLGVYLDIRFAAPAKYYVESVFQAGEIGETTTDNVLADFDHADYADAVITDAGSRKTVIDDASSNGKVLKTEIFGNTTLNIPFAGGLLGAENYTAVIVRLKLSSSITQMNYCGLNADGQAVGGGAVWSGTGSGNIPVNAWTEFIIDKSALGGSVVGLSLKFFTAEYAEIYIDYVDIYAAPSADGLGKNILSSFDGADYVHSVISVPSVAGEIVNVEGANGSAYHLTYTETTQLNVKFAKGVLSADAYTELYVRLFVTGATQINFGGLDANGDAVGGNAVWEGTFKNGEWINFMIKKADCANRDVSGIYLMLFGNGEAYIDDITYYNPFKDATLAENVKCDFDEEGYLELVSLDTNAALSIVSDGVEGINGAALKIELTESTEVHINFASGPVEAESFNGFKVRMYVSPTITQINYFGVNTSDVVVGGAAMWAGQSDANFKVGQWIEFDVPASACTSYALNGLGLKFFSEGTVYIDSVTQY